MSISTLESKNGMLIPSEYAASKLNPFSELPEVEASIRAEPKNAPIHGERDTE